MSLIAYQSPSPVGSDVVFTAASGGGDTIEAKDNGVLLVKNGSGSPITVTVVTPGNDKYGQARPDLTHSVPAGATSAFGPFGGDLEDSSTHVISVTYSAVTTVTVAALHVA